MEDHPKYRTQARALGQFGIAEAQYRRGPANYHHHYHNAIVGMEDADGRYNAKWLDLGGLKSPQNHDLGGVTTGDFRRGQGGLFCRITRPYNAVNIPELYMEAEQKRSFLNLDHNPFEGQDMMKTQNRYTKGV